MKIVDLMDLMAKYISQKSEKIAQEIDDYACEVFNVPKWLRNPRGYKRWVFWVWSKIKRVEIVDYQGYHEKFLQFKMGKKIVGELNLKE